MGYGNDNPGFDPPGTDAMDGDDAFDNQVTQPHPGDGNGTGGTAGTHEGHADSVPPHPGETYSSQTMSGGAYTPG